MTVGALGSDLAARREQVSYANLYLIAIVANLGSFLFGYDFGATSWLLVDLGVLSSESTDDASVRGTNFYSLVSDSAGMTGFIAAGASIGALITYIPLLFWGNHILKKDEILLASFLYFVGALLESTSGSDGIGWTNGNATGIALLISGRLVFGSGIAASFHAVPGYISELGPAQLRGMVGSITESMIVTGVVVGFATGFFYEAQASWVVVYRVAYITALLMGLLALFIPHSPAGLVRSDFAPEDVLESLRIVFPNADEEDVKSLFRRREEELLEAKRWAKLFAAESDADQSGPAASSSSASDAAAGASENAGCCDASLTTEVRVLFSDSTQQRCLLLAILLVILQIGTGQGVILYFSGDVFSEICPDSYDACLLGFGGVKLFSAYLMVGVADCWGRRDFLVWGTGVMVLGMLLLTVGLSQGQLEAALAGLYISVAGYEAGLGSFMWILLSEIFPRFTRGAANSLAVSTLFLFSTTLTFSLPYFYSASGLVPIFTLFTVVGGVSVGILYLYAPETRGVELEEAYKLVDERFRQSGCCGIGAGDGASGGGVLGDAERMEQAKRLL